RATACVATFVHARAASARGEVGGASLTSPPRAHRSARCPESGEVEHVLRLHHAAVHVLVETRASRRRPALRRLPSCPEGARTGSAEVAPARTGTGGGVDTSGSDPYPRPFD